MNNFEKLRPYALALLRIVAAYMFLLHGTAKFWEFPISMTGGNGAVTDPLMIVGGVIEIYLPVRQHFYYPAKWLTPISLCTLQVKATYSSLSQTAVSLHYFTL